MKPYPALSITCFVLAIAVLAWRGMEAVDQRRETESVLATCRASQHAPDPVPPPVICPPCLEVKP